MFIIIDLNFLSTCSSTNLVNKPPFSIAMTESDIKRCYDLLKDPRYEEGLWKRELEVFIKIKRKAELEAFSKYGLTNITEKYLPKKLEESKSF